MSNKHDGRRSAIIDTSFISSTSTLETSNFVAKQLYEPKCLKYRNIQYWPSGDSSSRRQDETETMASVLGI